MNYSGLQILSVKIFVIVVVFMPNMSCIYKIELDLVEYI